MASSDDSSNISHTESSLLKDISDSSALFRILDANLDRAREGLRIVEEWCRFGLNDQTKTAQLKHLRQSIAKWHTPEIRAARDTPGDLGTDLTHPDEVSRTSLVDVIQANFARTQEALRVLEEYAKLLNPEMSASCKQMRYQLYTLDSQVTLPLLRNAGPNAEHQAAQNATVHTQLTKARYNQLHAAHTYLVTSPVPDLLGVVEAALKGGIAIVQYREKTANDETRLHIAKAMRQLCHQYKALFIVNDRVDIAAAADADGVHLGQQDLPMDIARAILGPGKIVGRSTTNPQELTRAIDEKADYIGVGPVHETPTKPGKAAAGNEYVRYAAKHATMPWFTIGGLNADNLAPTLAAGATRVAVVRALMEAADPTAVARALVQQTAQESLHSAASH
ncbi:MAG: thiamine phosphate synthase [Cyanobacteria bacterium P01_C01_bin.121]